MSVLDDNDEDKNDNDAAAVDADDKDEVDDALQALISGILHAGNRLRDDDIVTTNTM